MHLGDFNPGDIVDFMFTTIDATGAPTQLAGSPLVRAYKDNGTTEDDSGITLTVDFDARTGLNHLRVDTSADSVFYASGAEITMVLTAGTVDAVPINGYKICSFSIENRNIKANVTAMAADVMTAAAAAADLTTELQSGLSTLDAAGVRTAVGLASANLDTQLSGVRNRLSTTVTKTGTVVDDVANSATTFKTDLTEATNDHFKDALLKFTSGSLAEQVKKITAYNGTTKFVTVSGGFTAEPTAGDTLEILND